MMEHRRISLFEKIFYSLLGVLAVAAFVLVFQLGTPSLPGLALKMTTLLATLSFFTFVTFEAARKQKNLWWYPKTEGLAYARLARLITEDPLIYTPRHQKETHSLNTLQALFRLAALALSVTSFGIILYAQRTAPVMSEILLFALLLVILCAGVFYLSILPPVSYPDETVREVVEDLLTDINSGGYRAETLAALESMLDPSAFEDRALLALVREDADLSVSEDSPVLDALKTEVAINEQKNGIPAKEAIRRLARVVIARS